jgi:RTX calcium-binding nonapeptide repeat (4 copies)
VKRRMLILAPILALLAAPSAASAVTQVDVEQVSGLDVVVVRNDDGPSTIEIATGNSSGNHVVAVRNASAFAGCQQSGADVGCLGDFDALVVFGNGGSDTVTMDLIADGGLPPLHGEAYGGEGDDSLKATPDNRDVPQPDTYIEGGNGNDTIVSGNGPDELHGGPGNDTMQAFEGADAVLGEDGDDSVSAGKEEPEANAADTLDGGPGFDQIPDVDADYNRGFDDDVSVTVDGAANDGEAGEGDNVIGVEKLRIVADHATFVGSDAGDDVFVEVFSSSLIRGMGGNDRLIAYDGNDTLEGGDGDDYLEGGFMNDVLDGGPGIDQFVGDRTERDVIAAGSDQIRARDGNAEQINCGIGADTAQVDAVDVVDATCESVDRAGSGPGGGGSGAGGPSRPKVLGKLSIRSISSKGLAIQITCPAACTVSGELRVDKKTARRLGLGRSRMLARGKKKLAAAGDAKVTLKVVSKARKRFKRMRSAKVTLRTTTTVAGKATTATKSLKLKR